MFSVVDTRMWVINERLLSLELDYEEIRFEAWTLELSELWADTYGELVSSGLERWSCAGCLILKLVA